MEICLCWRTTESGQSILDSVPLRLLHPLRAVCRAASALTHRQHHTAFLPFSNQLQHRIVPPILHRDVFLCLVKEILGCLCSFFVVRVSILSIEHPFLFLQPPGSNILSCWNEFSAGVVQTSRIQQDPNVTAKLPIYGCHYHYVEVYI